MTEPIKAAPRYKLVPIEPTEEMIEAIEKQCMVGAIVDMAKREWKAALAAAPEQPAPQSTSQVLAWITEEGDRVVTEQTMAGARADGGAMLSTLKPYSIPLGRVDVDPSAQPAPQPVAHIVINNVPAVEDIDLAASDEDTARLLGCGVHSLYAVPPDARAVIRQLVDVAQTVVAINERSDPIHARYACAEGSPLVDAAREALAAAAPFLDGGEG